MTWWEWLLATAGYIVIGVCTVVTLDSTEYTVDDDAMATGIAVCIWPVIWLMAMLAVFGTGLRRLLRKYQ